MAIVCANSLTVMGLKQLLQSVMPSIEVESYATVSDLRDDKPERFVHFFVEISAFISDRQFFAERQHRTIVLTTSPEHSAQLSGYHCLCVNVDEQHLARNLLLLIRQGHPNGHTMMSGKGHPMPPGTGHSMPPGAGHPMPPGKGHPMPPGAGHPMSPARDRNALSAREIEVLSLVAKGLINKEIADRLNISLTTVITHRKNIVEKLGIRSVSALTIHAVMNGYVDLDQI